MSTDKIESAALPPQSYFIISKTITATPLLPCT